MCRRDPNAGAHDGQSGGRRNITLTEKRVTKQSQWTPDRNWQAVLEIHHMSPVSWQQSKLH